ncbi:MAG TPA: hypothetical protein VFY31_02100 [Macromonas sp.]|nr:hypothetical protein [Macromonas sp.]
MWRIDFTSDKFLPFLPEEEQPNPACYGFELAYWLARQLAQCDIYTSYPVADEWGWHLELEDHDNEITIGCGCEAREGDGYAGKALPWFIFVRQYKRLNERLQGCKDVAKVRELANLVTGALEDERIPALLTET